ncbi:MAG: S8 family peptidase [Nocardioidaceae bacterium]
MAFHKKARRKLPRALVGLSTVAVLAGVTAAPALADGEQQDKGTIVGADRANAVEDSYIVVLDDEATAAAGVRSVAGDLASSYDAAVESTYNSALDGFTATMSESDAERLAADPDVAMVEVNQEFQIYDTQEDATWGLDRVDQRALPLDGTYTYATTAANVNAYIIDTGINLGHNDFEGRAQLGFDALGGDGSDCHGHGTHVAGTVGGETYGLAKDVNLFAVRVLDCEGSGTTDGVIAGVEWVTENATGPAVANMSLGGGASEALDAAVQGSIAAGVTYSVAAGNESSDACGGSPSRVPEALTVGATDDQDRGASFTNVGSCVDLLAPGVDITSDWVGSPDATETISGTSMAAPHVAGAAALYLSTNPDAAPAQVGEALVGSATPDVITNPGVGSPNLLLHTGTD